MYPLKNSTSLTITFFAHDINGDGVIGITDGQWTKRISKNGAAFSAMSVTITELENGWYSLPISTDHSNTNGILSISLSSASSKRVNLQYRIYNNILDDFALESTLSVSTSAIPEILIDTNNLDSRLTSTRATYLDKLNVDGLVASSTLESAGKVEMTVSSTLERPSSGSILYPLHLYIYDAYGDNITPGLTPVITATNHLAEDRSSNLSTVTLLGTGHYIVAYTVSSSSNLEQIDFRWTVDGYSGVNTHGISTTIIDTPDISPLALESTLLSTSADILIIDNKIDNVQIDLDNPDQFKADISGLSTFNPTTETVQISGTKNILDDLNDISTTDVSSAIDVILDTANTELNSVPNTTGSLKDMIKFLFQYFRGRKIITSTTETLYKEDSITSLGSSSISESTSAFTKEEMS